MWRLGEISFLTLGGQSLLFPSVALAVKGRRRRNNFNSFIFSIVWWRDKIEAYRGVEQIVSLEAYSVRDVV